MHSLKKYSLAGTYVILFIFQDVSVEDTLFLILCRHGARCGKSPIDKQKDICTSWLLTL